MVVTASPPVAADPARDITASAAARAATAMRRLAPEIEAEAVREIRHEVPEYAGPECARILERAAACVLNHFIGLIDRTGAKPDGLFEFFRRAGAAEAAAGRSLPSWQQAVDIAARAAIRHFSAVAAEPAGDVTPALYGQVISETFPYLNQITTAVAQGYAATAAAEPDRGDRARRLLVERLVGGAAPGEVRDLAREARWPLPERAAVVVLEPADDRTPARTALSRSILDGRHLPVPCLVVPGPDAPGRRGALEVTLRGQAAALGPAMPLDGLAHSFDLAREALDLARAGRVRRDGLTVATDHLVALAIARQREFVRHCADRRLAPLRELRPAQRYAFARTLQECLGCGFNASAAAERLGVHPQTVRYRLRRLEALFGDALYDPSVRMEFQVVLLEWLGAARPGRDPGWFRSGPEPRSDGGA